MCGFAQAETRNPSPTLALSPRTDPIIRQLRTFVPFFKISTAPEECIEGASPTRHDAIPESRHMRHGPLAGSVVKNCCQRRDAFAAPEGR